MERDEVYRILEKQYFGENIHEHREIADLPNLLRDVKVFWDIGASLGQYTYHANKSMRNGAIFAVEADPVRFERLVELAKKWQAESSNTIHPIHAAVSDSAGEIEFFTSNSNWSGGLFARENGAPSDLAWQKVVVPSITLDSLLSQSTPDFIKVDVEGAEHRLLLGATRLLATRGPQFLMEVHPWGDPKRGYSPLDVFDLFRANNYAFERKYSHLLFTKKRMLSPLDQLRYFKKKVGNRVRQWLPGV